MLDIVSSNPTLDLPSINPTVQAMLDIILTNASSGVPTMATDLVDFTPEQIAVHFPAARKLANKQVVRQIDEDPCYETREQLLQRASRLALAHMPTEANLHEALRRDGITNAQIADIWSDVMVRAAQGFVTLRVPHQEVLQSDRH